MMATIRTLVVSAVTLIAACLVSLSAFADDGETTVKVLSNNADVTVTPEEVGVPTSETDHAFIDMMQFYVPSQQASGELLPIIYNNADGVPAETLAVAKPLISVFIYGPYIAVEETAFGHSFMDAFAAVSLDDGETWKTTNLSQSADQSSFILGQSSGGGGGSSAVLSLSVSDSGGGGGNDSGGSTGDAPVSHTISKDGVMHAPGLNYPYTNQCTNCHGVALLGGHEGVPSCYSCHGKVWKESLPAGGGVIFITEAIWDVNNRGNDRNDRDDRGDRDDDRDNDRGRNNNIGQLKVEGEGAAPRAEVILINSITQEQLDTTRANRRGEFEFTITIRDEPPPCTVKAISDGISGLTRTVLDEDGQALEECEGEPVDLTNYPGGVHDIYHATAGNKVLVAWPGRYCQRGQPAYALENDTVRRDAIAGFIQTGVNSGAWTVPPLPGFNLLDDLYLVDAFGVAGSQGSIDFADEGFPQVGEVPFSCVWTARGVLLAGDDPRTADVTEVTHMVWTNPERLTSGRRDPFRIEVRAVKDAGFIITWQEDPEGLRPGQGEGPGEGWSGAVAHSQTDLWYSFINWDYFDVVESADDADDVTAINIASHDLTVSGRPQVFVPMAMPMRITNNARCNTDGANVTDPDLYCNFGEGDPDDGVADAADFGLKDQCAATVTIPTGQNNTPTPICVSEDGLPNVANTASTRPRNSLQGYDSDADGVFDSAWVILAAEESKGLGRFFFLPDGTPCIEGSSAECEEDDGKNQWYFSFDMGSPDTSATASERYGLVRNLVSQGNMLNQPEVDWRTGELYPVRNTAQMWNFGSGYDFDIVNTEIARRSSLLAQSIGKAKNSQHGLLAMSSWKQGVMRQGGPADTMLRRIVLPQGYVDGIANNPYAFTNIACNDWAYKVREGDVFNPYYPDCLCMDPSVNVSGVVPDTCIDTATDQAIDCPSVDFSASTYGIGDTNPILQGVAQGEGNTMKVLSWHQCPSSGVQIVGDVTAVTCDADTRTDAFVNLRDQSWYNPLDVSKGHRGFLDGDIVMFLYAWSPNWRLNAAGHDRYDLYVRRSFNGGETWTTTPADGTAIDGVTAYNGDGTASCETFRATETGGGGDIAEPHVCFEYPAGGDEQARNVTQHQAMRITTLDPRYAPTWFPGRESIAAGCVDADDPTINTAVMTCDDLSAAHDADVRNPSRYFIVYETGDNNTVVDGEAEPLDLYYSRAINFGDDYVVWADEVADATLAQCYPSDAHDDDSVPEVLIGSGFCNEFDRVNTRGDTRSSEADLEANPDGSKLYGVWAQWVFGADGVEIVESDAIARRSWWIDNFIPLNAWDFGQGSGDGVPANQ